MEFENYEQKLPKRFFIFPDLKKEIGEIERTARKYTPQNINVFVRDFFEKAKESELVDLTEEIWSKLKNTDSFKILHGEWNKVAEYTDYYNKEGSVSRNWQDLKQRMEQGQEIDAPIILKYLSASYNELYLVSGNTRLMIARALGKTPKVLLVEMKN